MKKTFLLLNFFTLNSYTQMSMDENVSSNPSNSSNISSISMEESNDKPARPSQDINFMMSEKNDVSSFSSISSSTSSVSMEESNDKPAKPYGDVEVIISGKTYKIEANGKLTKNTSSHFSDTRSSEMAKISNDKRNMDFITEPKTMLDASVYSNIVGNTKRIIIIPKSASEEDYKVEFQAFVITAVDQCNKNRLLGEFEKKEATELGYPYYKFNEYVISIESKLNCNNKAKLPKKVYS